MEESSFIDPSVFRRRHLQARHPLVLRRAMASMPAVNTWSIDFFRRYAPNHKVPVDGQLSGNQMSLGEYTQALAASNTGSTPAMLYMRNLQVFEHFPGLRKDFEMPWIAKPNWLQSPLVGNFSGGSWRFWVELFLSGPGSRFPFVHIDPYYTHAWSVQLFGSKVFWLWPPMAQQSQKLLAGTIERQWPKAVTADTDLKSFFDHHTPMRIILTPGDLAFIPAGWWHTTETSEASVTLGGNFVEASNWRDFRDSFSARNPCHSRRQHVERALSSALAPPLLRVADSLRRNCP